MTTVHISLGRDDGTTKTAAKGVVEWEPTTRREDGTMVILERGFVKPLVDGEVTVVVDPSGLTWCWRVTERTDSGGTVRYVSVPDSAVVVEYVDLPDVDPTTLVAWSPADPEAAYLARLADVKVSDLTDVDTTGLADGDAMVWDATAGKWVRVPLPSTYATKDELAAVGGAFVVDDTPAAPAEGTSATYFVTSAVTWPVGLEWSTDPDGGVAPTITGTALVSLFTYGGTTRAVLGATFPSLPAAPDTTDPTAGTLGVVMASTTADLTVTGATDETALHATPYAFTMDGGATWTAYQSGATYQYTGLTPETSYTFRHKVKDGAGNETLGTAVTDTTDAAPSDTTPPTAGTLAGSSITDDGFTLTVSGAADETALHAQPYRFSTNDGGAYSAYQTSPVYAATGLDPSTAYTCKHQTRDAAGNVSTGTAITVTTASSGPVTLVSDDFNRADTDAGLGTATTGQTWIADIGTLGIVSNRVKRVGSVNRSLIEVGQRDMYVSIKVGGTAASGHAVYARWADQNNYYAFDMGGDGLQPKLNAKMGGTDLILSIAYPMSIGDRYGVRVKDRIGGGATLEVMVNDVVKQTINHTDSTIVGTKAGILLMNDSIALDDFLVTTA